MEDTPRATGTTTTSTLLLATTGTTTTSTLLLLATTGTTTTSTIGTARWRAIHPATPHVQALHQRRLLARGLLALRLQHATQRLDLHRAAAATHPLNAFSAVVRSPLSRSYFRLGTCRHFSVCLLSRKNASGAETIGVSDDGGDDLLSNGLTRYSFRMFP